MEEALQTQLPQGPGRCGKGMKQIDILPLSVPNYQYIWYLSLQLCLNTLALLAILSSQDIVLPSQALRRNDC